PTSSETIVMSSTSRRRARIASSAALSTAVVSSPPSPCPTTGSRSLRVGSSTSTRCRSSTQARESSSQSVNGEEQQPARQPREEERRLLRHGAPAARDLPHVLDLRRAEQERAGSLPVVDRRLRFLARRGVGHAFGCERRHDLRVEAVAFDALV